MTTAIATETATQIQQGSLENWRDNKSDFWNAIDTLEKDVNARGPAATLVLKAMRHVRHESPNKVSGLVNRSMHLVRTSNRTMAEKVEQYSEIRSSIEDVSTLRKQLASLDRRVRVLQTAIREAEVAAATMMQLNRR